MHQSLINISSAGNGRRRRRTLTCAITAERQAPNSPSSLKNVYSLVSYHFKMLYICFQVHKAVLDCLDIS